MKQYGKRQVIFEPQDRDKVFILKIGRVEIYQLTVDGKKIIVDTLGPGNVFGDLGIDEPNELFVEATTDALVCVIKKDEFFTMITRNPSIANQLVKELFAKIIESESQVAALASDNLLTKVKNLLLRLAKKHGKKREERIVIPVKFTHEQLADMVGISRPTMTAILGTLAREGIISRKGKLISFDPQKLLSL